MIWHIFKKDWKLLWPMVAGVALIYFVHRIGLYELGHFNSKPTLLPLMNLLLYAEYIAPLFLVAFVVQQDAVPGVRQDWLVRPIKRRDLILAKILFVLLLVQGPMIAADAFEGLINGFSFGQSWGAAFSRGLWLFPFFFVAAIAFAALTPTLMEAIAAGVIIFLGGAVFGLTTATFVFHGRPQFWVEWSGLSWINLTEKTAVSLLCAIAILALIYFRRKILPARWIFGAGALCWMLTFFTPWTPAFAVQKWASSVAGAAHSIAVSFAPSLGKHNLLAVPNAEDTGRRVDEATTALSLPLRISGLARDTVLRADHYELRFVGDDGRQVDAGAGQNLEVFNEGDQSSATAYQVFRVPTSLYSRYKDQPVNFEIDYSLTLMRLAGAYGLPAINGDQRNPELGWCKTRINEQQTAVQLRCMQPTIAANKRANCVSGFLEASTGIRNPERFACATDYSPFMESETDSLTRMGINFPFRDSTGLAQYPVNGPQIPNARAVVRVYEPEEHFSRKLVIPSIRLGDWVGQ